MQGRMGMALQYLGMIPADGSGPTAVLRDRSDQRAQAYEAFVDDLRVARNAVTGGSAPLIHPAV